MKTNTKQTGSDSSVMGAVNPKATAVMAAKQLAFPNEFKRTLWESIDKRYAAILLATFLVVYGGMFIALVNYVAPSQADLNSLAKQQFMNKILKQSAQLDIQKAEVAEDKNDAAGEEKKEEVVEKTSTKGKTREETQSASFQEERAAAAAAAKEAYQQQVAAQASAVLATLAGRSRGGRASSAGSAADVLGGATGTTDLGSVLAGATGKDAQSGLGLGNATSRADIGRGGGVGGAKLGAVGAGTGLGAGSGVGDALARGGKIKASLATGKVKSTGASSRSVEELTSVIDQHQRAVQACYEQEKVKDPSLKGQIVIELRIDKDGKVVGPRVASSTMKNPNVERCILNKVRLWQFSSVTDPQPQVLNIPYVFAD